MKPQDYTTCLPQAGINTRKRRHFFDKINGILLFWLSVSGYRLLERESQPSAENQTPNTVLSSCKSCQSRFIL